MRTALAIFSVVVMCLIVFTISLWINHLFGLTAQYLFVPIAMIFGFIWGGTVTQRILNS